VQMNISIRHGHVSDATQAMIQEKLDKITRLYDRAGALEITIDLEHRDMPAVDLKVSAKKHDFVATGQAENLLAAVDVAVEKMEQQLRKHKEKVQDRHRGTGHREPE
jgi:putative sigma-54 modulation protein